ncbi:MAG: hypothetical protein ACT4PZ_01655 [Panacagrimonas sp.]
MDQALLGTIAATGFSVAFLHAALPTHWLPFVLAGRGQGWTHSRTLGVTALAGGGHVLFTVALGVLVAWLGIEVDRWIGSIFPWIVSAVLIGFGLYYWSREGHGHSHFGEDAHDHGHHHHHDHDHAVPAQPAPKTTPGARRSDTAVIVGLVSALTFSPCEGFLPVFVAGAKYGWVGFALLSLILAAATLAGMVLLTWLSLRGLQELKLEALSRYENRILGAVLIGLGLAVVVLET